MASICTIQSARGAHNGLDDAQDAFQSLLDVCILGHDGVLFAQHDLQVIVRLLALQVTYALVQAINLVLCALSDCALGLAVVCALAGELFGGEVGDTARIGACPALFARLAIGGSIVPRGPFGSICLARGRHAHGWVWDAIQEGFGQILPRVMSLDTAWRVASTRFARRTLASIGNGGNVSEGEMGSMGLRRAIGRMVGSNAGGACRAESMLPRIMLSDVATRIQTSAVQPGQPGQHVSIS